MKEKKKIMKKNLNFLIKGHQNFFDIYEKKFELGIKYCFDDVLQIQEEVRVEKMNKINMMK